MRSSGRDLLELHEDEVPDLDEAVAVGVGRAGRAAGNPFAVVVEDLRARAARPGIAHRPEIVGAGDADDARFREAGDLLPEVERLVVVDIDGGGQLLLRQAEFLGDEVPGELDRAFLEVVAEGEVAEHLEEGVVARGVADIVEVVVLAAGAHAFLRRDRARERRPRLAGEIVLELHHAGIGEHQRRIVARHERARGHDLVPFAVKVVQERRADFVDACHRFTAAGKPAGFEAFRLGYRRVSSQPTKSPRRCRTARAGDLGGGAAPPLSGHQHRIGMEFSPSVRLLLTSRRIQR